MVELCHEAFRLGELTGGQLEAVAKLGFAAQVGFEVKQQLKSRYVFEVCQRQAEGAGFEKNVDQVQLFHVGVTVLHVAAEEEDVAGGDGIRFFVQSMLTATVGDEDQLQIYTDTEVKTIDINRNCSNQSIYLTWLNYLGGMDSWVFTAQKDYGVDIEDVQETENNIFINWPNSYSDGAIKYEIKRQSRETILVRSQNLTLDQVNGLKYIKTSPLIQTYDNLYKNVLVDNSSFTVYSESDKLYSISFTISMTDQVPSQSL